MLVRLGKKESHYTFFYILNASPFPMHQLFILYVLPKKILNELQMIVLRGCIGHSIFISLLELKDIF